MNEDSKAHLVLLNDGLTIANELLAEEGSLEAQEGQLDL